MWEFIVRKYYSFDVSCNVIMQWYIARLLLGILL